MSSRPMLDMPREADEVVRLRREISGLEKELQEAKDEATMAKQASSDALHAIRALRKQLEGLYSSLRMVFGEISRVEVGEIEHSESSGGSGRLSPKLEMMKKQLGGRQAEFIDFLAHGPLSTAQLAAAGKCHRDTVAQVIHKLTRAGLIEKNGNRFFLKDL